MAESIKNTACPNCNHQIAIYHNFTQVYGCTTCGTISAFKDGLVVATSSKNPISNPNYKEKSFIKLGQSVTYHGKNYLIIGRLVWSSDYKEYYSEDGEEGYSNEKWSYHEWILSTEKGEILYLFEDDEGYHFAESMKVKYPDLPVVDIKESNWILGKNKEKIHIKNFLLNSAETVTEIGHSTLQYIEGEVPWETQLNEKIFFATYDDGGKRYTVETEPEEKDPTKASYFKEWKVGKRHLMNCFGANQEISQQLEQAETDSNKYTFWGLIFGAFTLISFVLYMVAGSKKGDLIKEQTFIIPAATDTISTDIKPSNAGRITNIKLKEGPVKVVLKTNMPPNSDLWAGVEIHDEQDEVVNALDDQFYDEEGTEYWQEDGESGYEYYHEMNTEKSELFDVEKAGEYAFEVYVAPQSMIQTTVQVAVYQNVLSNTFFMVLGIMGLIITALIILIGYNSMPWN